EAVDEVGPADEDFFLFSEETDWCYRFRAAGWEVWFDPEAEFHHVGGASHGGRMYVENLRGNLRFLAKHRGPAAAERARRLRVLARLHVPGPRLALARARAVRPLRPRLARARGRAAEGPAARRAGRAPRRRGGGRLRHRPLARRR